MSGVQSLHVTAIVNNDGNDVLQKVFSDDLSYEGSWLSVVDHWTGILLPSHSILPLLTGV